MDNKLLPFNRWAINVVSPLLRSIYRNEYVITAINVATRWPIARAVKLADDKVIAQFIYEEIYSYYGPPRELLSNNSKNFLLRVVAYLMA